MLRTPFTSQVLDLNLSAYDGIALRIKGDGQMYKLNLKTAERGEDPESTYAATFETTGEALFYVQEDTWICCRS